MIKGSDHIEPQLADIPGLRRQPSDAIRQAYWYGVRLHNYGWLLQSVECVCAGFACSICDGPNCTVEVVLETPTHRATTYRADHRTKMATELPEIFAMAVRSVAVAGGERAVKELRKQLRALLGEYKRPALHHASVHHRPFQIARSAAYELIDEHRWVLSGIGSEIAGGGFIADIPGDTIAVYPAGMAGDGTLAGALAHAIGNLAADQIALLANQIGAYQQQVEQFRASAQPSQGKAA